MMTGRLWILILTAFFAGCGDAPPVDPAPMALALSGSWTGHGTFEQTRADKTAAVEVALNLAFDDQGVPLSLPALGMISPWRLYVSGSGGLDPSPAGPLSNGGSLWAYCPWEADGEANELHLQAGAHSVTATSTEWQYGVTYRFADLLQYNLYDYTQPDAPEVRLDARDTYQLTAADRLIVQSRATGAATAGGQPVVIRFDAELTRGESPLDVRCRLGAPRP
jgi:hypothetical protein